MNYQHLYHAGNFADVFKHIILLFCLEKLQEKPTPFFVLETHAGAGKYDLNDERVERTGEAERGIKKIFSQKNFTEILPQNYLKILAKVNCCEVEELSKRLNIYAGSPTFIKNFLRTEDRAIFAEKHSQTFLQLRRNFAGNKKIITSSQDGFHLLKSKLPPLQKRGLILIDPAFEKDQNLISQDYERIIEGLIEAHKRFAHGIYLVWYPLISGEQKLQNFFHQQIKSLKFEKSLHLIFDLGSSANEQEQKMKSCGMFVFNAPWQLKENLDMVLPKVLQVLQNAEDAVFTAQNF